MDQTSQADPYGHLAPPRRPNRRRWLRWIIYGISGACVVIVLAAVIVALTGSGHKAVAKHTRTVSASAACHDFSNYAIVTTEIQPTRIAYDVLAKAVSEAPSGTLFRDMNRVTDAVITMTAKGSPLTGTPGAKLAVLEAIQQVVTDCQQINPSGG